MAIGHEVLAPARSEMDLGSAVQVNTFLREAQPEGLVHLAWTTEHGVYWNCPSNLDWVARSLNLITAFRTYGGQRLFVAGTSAEYDWSKSGNHREEETLKPQKLYGICKDSLRRILQAWCAEVDLSFAWGRIFCPFGSGEDERRLLPRMIRDLRERGRIDFEGGSEMRDFLHVEDLGEAVAAVFDSEVCGSVNLASGVPISISDFVKILAEVAGGKVCFATTESGDPSVPCITADVSRLRDEVGWSPRVDWIDRLRQTWNQ